MNKFDELQVQLENIIVNLGKQIEAKQHKINDLNELIAEDESNLIDLKEITDSVTSKIDTLSEIKGRSIILYLIKKGIKAEFYQYYKEKNWFLLSFLIISSLWVSGMLVVCLLNSPSFFALITGILALLTSVEKSKEIISLRRLKKDYTIAGLNDNILDIEKSRSINKNNIKERKEETEKLHEETQALQKEKAYYEEALRSVLATKEQIISQRVSSILDKEFDEQQFGDIIRRIRLRKEGEKNNGEII